MKSWFPRISEAFPKMTWLNSSLRRSWEYAQSSVMIRHMIEDRMYPHTVKGLLEGLCYLSK